MVQHADIDHTGLTGVGGALTVKDEGGALTTSATTLDFVGAGVTATGTGATKTITIPGDAAGTIQTFSPTWTSTGTQPSIVNGSITGHYQKIADKLYWVCIVITIGSSTTAGTGNYTIGNLPFTVKSTSPTRQIIHAYYRDTGTDNFVGMARFGAGGTGTETIFFADLAAAKAWTATAPVAPASTDEIFFEGVLASD